MTDAKKSAEIERAQNSIAERQQVPKEMKSKPDAPISQPYHEWMTLGQLASVSGVSTPALSKRVRWGLDGVDNGKWSHYEKRNATTEDRRRLKKKGIKRMYRIAPGKGTGPHGAMVETTGMANNHDAEVDKLKASIAARDQLIADLRPEVERLQKETPVRRVKTGGKAKQLARQLSQVQRGYAHIQQEHKRLLAHCREIEQQLQEHVNNSNATLTVNDDDYYDQLNGESVVVTTTNGEIRVWLDEGQHVRVHGAMNGKRMTCEELNDVLAALVAARWHPPPAGLAA